MCSYCLPYSDVYQRLVHTLENGPSLCSLNLTKDAGEVLALHTRKVLGRSRLGLGAQIFHLRANIKEHQTPGQNSGRVIASRMDAQWMCMACCILCWCRNAATSMSAKGRKHMKQSCCQTMTSHSSLEPD